MVDIKRRASTVQYAVPNLRYRWKEELKPFTDNQVAACYEDFGFSEDFGNNDEKFPLWFEMLEEYPKELPVSDVATDQKSMLHDAERIPSRQQKFLDGDGGNDGSS